MPATTIRPTARRSTSRTARAPQTTHTACALAVAAALAQMAQPAVAANCTWNPASGNWSVAGNWSCSLVPGAADTATIAATRSVTIDTTQSILSLSNAGTVNIDAFLLNLSGGGSTTNTGTINVGGPSTAALQVGHNVTNTGGTINVSNGSAVNLLGFGITGGTIATTGTGAVVANGNSNNRLSGLTLNGRLNVTGGGAAVRLTNVTLNGSTDIGSSGSVFLDGTAGPNTISGNGTFNLVAGSRLTVEGPGNQTLGSGVVVRGAGTLFGAALQGGAPTLTNNGLISADVNGGTLSVQRPANSGSIVNNGVMEARGGGTLLLGSDVAQTTTGRITAEADSRVTLGGVTVSGGTISTVGTGTIGATNNSANAVSGVTVNGTLDLASQPSQLRVTDGLVLNGAMNIGPSSIVYVDNRGTATQSITGAGTIRIESSILRFEANSTPSTTATTTLGNDIAVRGYGTIGQAGFLGGAHQLINNGTISADVASQTLNIVPIANGGLAIQNNGTLEATNGGRLLLSTGVVGAVGSQIRAGDSSIVELNGVTLSGTINSTGSGSFRATNNQTNALSGVTLTGTMDLASQPSQLRIANGLVLNGGINVGGSSTLYIDNRPAFTPTQAQSITGTGTIRVDGGTVRFESDGQTTFGSNVAVRGYGLFGQAGIAAGNHQLVNNGTISADVANQTLNVVGIANNGPAIQNNGTLEATNGGRLLLSTGVVGGVGSQIRAGDSSVVELNGVTLSGTINSTGTGSFRASNNFNNQLAGVALTGNMDLASQASQLRISNGLVLNGTMNIGGGSIVYVDNRTTPTQSITGTGTMLMAGNLLRFEGDGQTTLGSGIAVRGYGTIGQAGVQAGNHLLVNNGSIVSDVVNQTLNIVPIANNGPAIQNNGTLGAANGATLQLSASVAGGAGSQYSVDSGSRIVMNGVTLSGVVNQTGSGAIEATNNFNNALSAASLTGRVNVGTSSGSQLRITDGLTMSGPGTSITVGAQGQLFLDNRSTAAQTIGGTGQIVLAGGTIRADGGTSTTLGSGVTLRGNGTIGQAAVSAANQTLINNGTIIADGGTLSFVPIANQGGIQGTGTMRVDGGTLSLGTAQPTQQGTLDIRSTGTLALGNQNITLSNDYTNTQAGTGNAFNRRAGVTGTGQILAGGNVAQAITGANVTGGNTANATLTIGNVRVGTTTFDYQVANTGTTGPTLRGALQTAANGGNVTDARLSGAGVTAANYAAGAPGGNSGNLGVNFTAATAGALAPMSGQVVNLRSNFDNIADQKLNITIAAGAGAYNVAQGSAAPSPTVTVANQRIGGAGTTALTISNTAAAGSFTETLNASFTGSTGAATNNGGAITGGVGSGVAGGASNSTAMAVGVNTATAGAKTGSVTIGYVSNGTGTSGLASIGVGSQTLNVQGNVYQVANPTGLPTTVNFGNYRVGSTLSQNVAVANSAIAPAGFQEGLNASATATGAATVTGAAVTNLAAGSSTNFAVGMASNAGVQNGQVNFALASNGTGTSGLATLALAGQSVAVQGTGYVAATGTLNAPTTLNFGTVQVGQSVSQVLSITNSATGAAGFVEDLNVRFGTSSGTGASQILGTGQITGLTAGSTNASGMTVSVNTGTAGTINGSIGVNYFSAGTVAGVSNGLGELAVGSSQFGVNGVIQTTGNVINQASPLVNTPQPIALGNVRVGDASPSAAVSVTNVATSAPQAALNASIAGNGQITGTGSFNLLAPGATNATALQVGMNTATAGARNGTATISFVSDASLVGGCGSNCQLTLASQNVSVTGGVYQAAQANVPTSVNLGNVRVGTTATGSVAITNTLAPSVPAGFQEGLKASVSGTSGGATASGSFANIAAGGNASLGVSQLASAAGVNTGTVSLALASTGAGTSGLADLALPGANVNVQATGYRTANGPGNAVTAVQAPAAFAARVGDAPVSTVVNVTNTSPDAFTERLNVTGVSGASGPFAASLNGAATGIAAQASAGAVGITMSTAASGSFSNALTLDYASSGAGTTGAADLDVGTGTVTIAGRVYQTAVAQLASAAPIDFGIVHVGDDVSRIITLTNGAVNTGVNDVLAGTVSTSGAGFTGGGTLGAGLGAGQSAQIGVGLNTSTSGVFSGSAQFALASRNAEMADLSLGAGPILLSGQVNNFASAGFSGSGLLQTGENSYLLDLGTVTLGSAGTTASLFALNDATGLADLLAGSFLLGAGTTSGLDFAYTGFDAFSGLGAGATTGALGISFGNTGALGTYDDLITLSGIGSNASGFSAAVSDVTLQVRVSVVQGGGTVPLPSSVLLLIAGLLPMLGAMRVAARRRLH